MNDSFQVVFTMEEDIMEPETEVRPSETKEMQGNYNDMKIMKEMDMKTAVRPDNLAG